MTPKVNRKPTIKQMPCFPVNILLKRPCANNHYLTHEYDYLRMVSSI